MEASNKLLKADWSPTYDIITMIAESISAMWKILWFDQMYANTWTRSQQSGSIVLIIELKKNDLTYTFMIVTILIVITSLH
jgi:hypothetical protein